MTNNQSEHKKTPGDEVRMLASLLQRLKSAVDFGGGPLSCEPVANWSFTWDAESDRADLWRIFSFYQSQLFPIRTKWYFDTELEFAEASEMARQIVVNRSYDPNEFHLLDRLLVEGMTFIDVGSNFGAYAIFASVKVGAAGRVIAFEPSRRELLALHRNIAINRLLNVQVYSVAVADASGTSVFSVADGKYSGHNRLGELAVVSTLPTLRLSTDMQHHHWASLNNGVTEIAIGKAGALEILIYGDEGFEFSIARIELFPASGMIGPWRVGLQDERPMELPSELRKSFAQFHSGVYGIVHISGGDALNLRGSGKSGAAFRCRLDPSHDYTLFITGQGSSDPHVAQYPVDVVSLDEFLLRQDFKSIDVVKIDIEGSEIRALRGAVNLIQKYAPLLIVEVGEASPQENTTTSELSKFFAALGYVLFDVTQGTPRLIDLAGEHGANIIAVPERFLDSVLRLGGMDRSALTAGLTPDAPTNTQPNDDRIPNEATVAAS